MTQSKMITGKLSRTLKTTAMATNTGLRHLGYLGKKNFSKDPVALQKKHEEDIGKILFKGLSQMRGTALKASQLLSMEADILPEGIRKELVKSCYQVPPINKALVRKAFMQEFSQSPGELFSYFNSSAFAAASLGQVHAATHSNGQALAVKVQYPSIRESIDSDLKILNFVVSTAAKASNLLPSRDVLDTALAEISSNLKEETDYIQEAENTEWFRENMKVKHVVIPRTFPEYSSTKILSTEFLSGLHVDDWLATEPSQVERDRAGQIIFNAFIYSAFELHAMHADPHIGNYLFLENGDIGLIDFGCVKHISPEFTESISKLISALVKNDHGEVFESYKELKIFSPELSYEEYQTNIQPTLAPLQQWMVTPYKNKQFDFSQLPPPPRMEPHEHKKAITYFHGLTSDQMYFDRSYFGIYQLLKKIGACVSTENPWISV